MKRFTFIFASVIMLLSLASCSGEQKITPSKSTISGPLGEYFKVVDRPYKVTDGRVNIEIERTDYGLPDPWEEGIKVGWGINYAEPGFVVEYMDEEGDILCKEQTEIVPYLDALTSIVALSVGESASISFRVKDKKISKFRVSSTFECSVPSEPDEDEDSSSDDYSSVGSIMDEVSREYTNALRDAQKEMEDAYKEAASEVADAMSSALDGLF